MDAKERKELRDTLWSFRVTTPKGYSGEFILGAESADAIIAIIEPLLAAKDKEIERLKEEMKQRPIIMGMDYTKTYVDELRDNLRAAEQSLEKVRDKAILARDALECDNTHRANLYVKELLAIIDKGEKDEG